MNEKYGLPLFSIASVRCWWEALPSERFLEDTFFGWSQWTSRSLLSKEEKGSCMMGGDNYRIERVWREKGAAFSLIIKRHVFIY
jgi:hypothetical protein